MKKYYVVTYFQIVNGLGLVGYGTHIFKTKDEAKEQFNEAVKMIKRTNSNGRVTDHVAYVKFGYKNMGDDVEYVTLSEVVVE